MVFLDSNLGRKIIAGDKGETNNIYKNKISSNQKPVKRNLEYLDRNTLQFCSNWKLHWFTIFMKSEKIYFQGANKLLLIALIR